MKKLINILLCILLFLASKNLTYGQKTNGKLTIEGVVVVDAEGEKYPVEGAVILLDGKKAGAVTNNQGYYRIRVRKYARTIGVSANGGMLEEAIDGRNKIDFTYPGLITGMSFEDDNAIDIGYGKADKRDLTGPVDKIDGDKLKNAHYDNIYELIRGKASGVEVNGNSIRVRNASSLGAGSEPLYVVDGVPVNTISNIDPQMVSTVEVLKGASASIYGTRGGNGVILINLKK